MPTRYSINYRRIPLVAAGLVLLWAWQAYGPKPKPYQETIIWIVSITALPIWMLEQRIKRLERRMNALRAPVEGAE
jgi:hypothetical protein